MSIRPAGRGWHGVLLGALLLWGTSAGAQAPSSPKRVLVLHFYGSYFAAIQRLDQGLRSVFERSSPDELDFSFDYLDATRLKSEAEQTTIARHLAERYDDEPLAAIVAVGDGVLTFLRRHQLFETVPVVTWGERASPEDDDRRNVTYVWDGPTAYEAVSLAKQLHPDARRLVIVGGRPGNDGAYERDLVAQLQPIRDGLEISFLTDLPSDELKARLRALAPDSFVLLTRLILPNSQVNRLPAPFFRELSDLSPVPMYGMYDTQVGNGVVAAYCHDLIVTGRELGSMVVRVARGEYVGSTAMLSPAAPIFDDRELRRWSIPRSHLPVTAVVRFEDPTFLKQYGGYVLAAVGLALLQAGFIFALLIQSRRRRQVEDQHTAMLRAMPDMMFLQRADGTYLKYHSRDQGRLVAPPEWFLGRRMRDVLPPEVLQQVEPSFERAARHREPAEAVYVLEMPDGRHHYEAQIVPCGESEVLSVIRDVTERRHAEAALQRSQDRYEVATVAGGVGVWDLNLDTHEIFVDSALRSVLGDDASPNSAPLGDWAARVHPEDVGVVLARAEGLLRGDAAVYEGEHRMLHRDGSVRWFLARGSIVPREFGAPRRLVGTATDITKRKQSEHALVETREELARVSRLTALGEFAASIAHEVRQPLAAIVMNAEAALRELGAPRPAPDLRATLQEIVNAGRRADDVIAHNRELFRSRTVQRVPLDLNDTIAQATLLIRTRLQHSRVTLETRLSRDLPTVLGDTVELQQVLLNLIVNGVEAMDGVPASNRRLVIATALTPDGALVSVSDRGVGLNGVDRQRMFTTSYTTKLTGTGVGLSICRAIVEAHGGRIWAEPNQGPGACFFFTIPTDVTAPMPAFSTAGAARP